MTVLDTYYLGTHFLAITSNTSLIIVFQFVKNTRLKIITRRVSIELQKYNKNY